MLSLLFTEVFRCIRTCHPPSPSFNSVIRFESLTARFFTCEDRSGWQIIPTQIIILIEIIQQITEYVCKNPHLYNLCLSQYNSAKITTNTWVSDAVELDIYVSVTLIYKFVMFYCFKLTNIYLSYTLLKEQKNMLEHRIKRYDDYLSAGLTTFYISSPQPLPPAIPIEKMYQ